MIKFIGKTFVLTTTWGLRLYPFFIEGFREVSAASGKLPVTLPA